MSCGRDLRGPAMFDKLSAFFGQSIITAQHGLSGSSAQADDNGVLQRRTFGLEPWIARLYFGSSRLIVNPPLTALLEFEMLSAFFGQSIITAQHGLSGSSAQ